MNAQRLLALYDKIAEAPGAIPRLEALGFGTTFIAINKKQLTQFPLPLPPLAEQQRIVAKVEELMGVLDKLETTLATADTTRDSLLESLLHNPDLGRHSAQM